MLRRPERVIGRSRRKRMFVHRSLQLTRLQPRRESGVVPPCSARRVGERLHLARWRMTGGLRRVKERSLSRRGESRAQGDFSGHHTGLCYRFCSQSRKVEWVKSGVWGGRWVVFAWIVGFYEESVQLESVTLAPVRQGS